MKHDLDLNDRAFEAIIKGTKKVEIRANTLNHDYSNFNVNDIIYFHNSKENTIACKILEINHYDSIEELLTLEGTKYTTSSTNDYNQAVKNLKALNGYEEAIKKSGVYAIHIQYIYNLENIWEELLTSAKKIQSYRKLSDKVEVGSVAAAILSTNGNIYTGICIDTACSIGMCAERNALSTMISNGENEIEKLVCIDKYGNLMMPCGVCREFIMQISKNNKDMKILVDNNKNTITLNELLPNWWN